MTLTAKLEGLLEAQTVIAHSGYRGNGPLTVRTIQSGTGKQYKVIGAGQGVGAGGAGGGGADGTQTHCHGWRTPSP